MATLGDLSSGAVLDNNATGVIGAWGPYQTNAQGGVPSKATIEIFDWSAAASSQKWRLCIFNDDGTGLHPSTTCVGVTDEITLTDVANPGDHTYDFPNFTQQPAPTLLANTNYWISLWWGTSTGTGFPDYLKAPFTSHSHFQSGVTYSSSAKPVVPSWTDGGTGEQAGIFYFTYAAAVTSVLGQYPTHVIGRGLA